MEEILKIASVGICCGILTILLKQYQKELAIPLMIGGGVIIVFFVLEYISNANTQILQLATEYEIDISYIKIIIRVIAIAYICQFSCELLKDSGLASVASKVELAGRLVIFSYAFPIAKALLGKALEVLSYM